MKFYMNNYIFKYLRKGLKKFKQKDVDYKDEIKTYPLEKKNNNYLPYQ